MACSAPAAPLDPPTWHMPAEAGRPDSIMLGFVTYGTPEQVKRAGEFVEGQGARCGIIKAEDGRTELMVIFDKTTTEQSAFSMYKRVADGEFATKDTGYIVIPANALKR